METLFKYLRIVFILIPLILIINYCSKKDDEVKINVQVLNYQTDSIAYYASKDGNLAYPIWRWKRAQLDSTGNTELNFSMTMLNSVYIIIDNKANRLPMDKAKASLLVIPGESYEIVFNPEAEKPYSIDGLNYEGQYLYSKLGSQLLFDPNIFEIEDPNLVFKIIEDSISTKLESVNELFKNKKIDKEFYDILKTEIEYKLSNILVTYLNYRLKRNIEQIKSSDNDLNIILNSSEFRYIEKIFEEYPYDNPYARYLHNYGHYLSSYLSYRSIIDSISTSLIPNKDLNLQLAEEYFDPFLFEFYFASQFAGVSIREPIEKMEHRYVAFKASFPQSKYLYGIEELIGWGREIYAEFWPDGISTDKNDLHPEAVLIDNYQNIKSLKEILKTFHGQVVYVDFWASWCPPCHGEFSYSDTIQEFAKNNNIVLLYISKDKEEEGWIKTISKFELKGYHARTVTNEFRSELDKYKIKHIPWYMIVDKNGEIVVKEALHPSSQEELFSQLSKYIN